MRSSHYCADNTRHRRLAAVEDLDVDPLRNHAKRCEFLFHIRHETIRSAEIDIRLSRHASRVEDRSRQVTRPIKILAHLVGRARPAVTNVAAAIWQRQHETSYFGSERMMLAIASRVQP